jgi:hypothetical protein
VAERKTRDLGGSGQQPPPHPFFKLMFTVLYFSIHFVVAFNIYQEEKLLQPLVALIVAAVNRIFYYISCGREHRFLRASDISTIITVIMDFCVWMKWSNGPPSAPHLVLNLLLGIQLVLVLACVLDNGIVSKSSLPKSVVSSSSSNQEKQQQPPHSIPAPVWNPSQKKDK